MSDWADWAQDRRIREAEESISQLARSHRAERRRLTEQLRQQSGDLQQQITRLREAFIAFVELEDVRGELAQHADAAAARRYAREVVAASVVGGRPYGMVEPADVPGYWLPAAARALTADVAGRAADADHELAEARLRDPVRTAVLVCLLEAVRRRPRWAPEQLAQVLPQGHEVTRAQRLVWTAVAEGRLGEPAREQLLAGLTALARDGSDDAVVAHLVARQPQTGNVPAEIAAGRLRTLRSLVAGGARPGDGSAEGSEDPLSDCLRDLVDEGAPHEAEILERMRGARARMDGLAPATDGERWDQPVGDAVGLLLGDLGSTHPQLHELALHALGPSLARTADRLHDEAQTPAPTEAAVALPSSPVTVTAEGPTRDDWRAEERKYVAARHPVPTWLRPAALAAAAVGLLGFVLIVVAPALAWLGVAGVVAAVALGYQDHARRSARDRDLAVTLRVADEKVAKGSADLRDVQERTAAARASADEDHEVVRGLLGPGDGVVDAAHRGPALPER